MQGYQESNVAKVERVFFERPGVRLSMDQIVRFTKLSRQRVATAMQSILTKNVGVARTERKGVYLYNEPVQVGENTPEPEPKKRVRPGYYLHDSMQSGEEKTFVYVGKMSGGMVFSGPDASLYLIKAL